MNLVAPLWLAIRAIQHLTLQYSYTVMTVIPTIPPVLQKLQQLDLSFNSLEGSLPSSWSSMVSLQQLWANTNKLSGPLPASWGAMASLQVRC
jgi:hypothetical protein